VIYLAPDETVLSGLYKAGYAYAIGCRRGGCAVCFFVRDLRAPFGGVGSSGIGREGGNFSREFFTEPKAVIMQIDPA
jgi:acyl-CoA reductase-like NAD-dependent aldehyde dehydrogenase